MKNIFQEFIVLEQGVDWWNKSNISQIFCKYSCKNYDKNLFRLCELVYPLSLVEASEKRTSEFLAGRYCAKQALANYGMGKFQVKIGENRNPLWPEGFSGSISHTNDVATAVVSNDENIIGLGADVERVITPDYFDDVKTHVLTPGEFYLLNSRKYSKNEMLTIIFSLKESFFKAAYNLTKSYFGFEAVRMISIDIESGTAMFCLNENLHGILRKNDVFEGQFTFVENNLIATLVTLRSDDIYTYSCVTKVAV